jgi:branched-chain amino acid transport system permease protein
VIEAASFWLSNNYQDIWPILLGVLLLMVIMFRPAGLISLILDERERVGRFGRSHKGPVVIRTRGDCDDAA